METPVLKFLFYKALGLQVYNFIKKILSYKTCFQGGFQFTKKNSICKEKSGAVRKVKLET